MTTIHTTLAPAPPSVNFLHLAGLPKWKVNKQSLRYNYPPSQSARPLTAPPPMFLHGVIPATPEPTTSFYYGQPYVLRPQVQVHTPQVQVHTPLQPQSPPPPPTVPPRPFVTITQYNYQPVGYQHVPGQATPASIVFGPPPRDKRGVQDTHRYYQSTFDLDRPASSRIMEPKIYSTSILTEPTPKRNDLKSDSSTTFEFTLHPEQIVSSVVEDKSPDCYHCQHHLELARIPEETNYTPRMWTELDLMDPLRIEDDELTKFIVDGCLKAEAIAVRNQHRPCFKNIKHLCTRTRTDILKPKTTVANIHSQGIPWATKDFIFAFVRLINCWYILKGYLDDHEGSLGKIEQTLTPEFKEVYQRWQNINKEMVKHLITIFVNLDNGICVQNAEIFSSFNQARKILSSCSLPNEENNTNLNLNECKSCPLNRNQDDQDNKSSECSDSPEPVQVQSKIDSYIDEKIKHQEFEGKSVPGILRIKNVFKNASVVNINKEDDVNDDKKCKHKIYMKPGSYKVPKRDANNPVQTPRPLEIKEQHEYIPQCTQTHDQVWKFAVKSFKPFIRNQMNDSDSNSSLSSERDQLTERSLEDDTEDWINDNFESLEEEEIEEPPRKSKPKIIVSKTFKRKEKKNVRLSPQSEDEITETSSQHLRSIINKI